jgi:hypothetical protein
MTTMTDVVRTHFRISALQEKLPRLGEIYGFDRKSVFCAPSVLPPLPPPQSIAHATAVYATTIAAAAATVAATVHKTHRQ